MTMVKKEIKQSIITKFERHKKDTGSPEVQVALLTERITSLVEHLKKNTKDNHSRRGLLMLVSQRRKLLNYLQSEDSTRFKVLASSLGLR